MTTTCSTPYGNQRKITLLAVWPSGSGLSSAQRLTAIRGKSRSRIWGSPPHTLQCSTPYGNQRKITHLGPLVGDDLESPGAQRLTAIRGKSLLSPGQVPLKWDRAQRLTAIRGKSPESVDIPENVSISAQRLTAIRGKSPPSPYLTEL